MFLKKKRYMARDSALHPNGNTWPAERGVKKTRKSKNSMREGCEQVMLQERPEGGKVAILSERGTKKSCSKSVLREEK